MADLKHEPNRFEVVPDGLFIEWQDGLESLLPHRYVRGHCGCAQCVDEITHLRHVGVDDVEKDVTIEDAFQVGRYAVNLLFSDLHETGIYPFRFLRELAEGSG